MFSFHNSDYPFIQCSAWEVIVRLFLMRLRLVSTCNKISVCACNLCIFNTNSCTTWTNPMGIFWYVHHLMQQQMKLPRGWLFPTKVTFLTRTFCASMLPHIIRKNCNLATSFLCLYCNFFSYLPWHDMRSFWKKKI